MVYTNLIYIVFLLKSCLSKYDTNKKNKNYTYQHEFSIKKIRSCKQQNCVY